MEHTVLRCFLFERDTPQKFMLPVGVRRVLVQPERSDVGTLDVTFNFEDFSNNRAWQASAGTPFDTGWHERNYGPIWFRGPLKGTYVRIDVWHVSPTQIIGGGGGGGNTGNFTTVFEPMGSIAAVSTDWNGLWTYPPSSQSWRTPGNWPNPDLPVTARMANYGSGAGYPEPGDLYSTMLYAPAWTRKSGPAVDLAATINSIKVRLRGYNEPQSAPQPHDFAFYVWQMMIVKGGIPTWDRAYGDDEADPARLFNATPNWYEFCPTNYPLWGESWTGADFQEGYNPDNPSVSITVIEPGSAALNDIQHIIVLATGGTFTLSYDGATTAALAYNISAAALQTALEGLAGIGAGQVSVSAITNGWSVEFTGTLAGASVSLLTINSSGLTGSGVGSPNWNISQLSIGDSQGYPLITGIEFNRAYCNNLTYWMPGDWTTFWNAMAEKYINITCPVLWGNPSPPYSPTPSPKFREVFSSNYYNNAWSNDIAGNTFNAANALKTYAASHKVAGTPEFVRVGLWAETPNAPTTRLGLRFTYLKANYYDTVRNYNDSPMLGYTNVGTNYPSSPSWFNIADNVPLVTEWYENTFNSPYRYGLAAAGNYLHDDYTWANASTSNPPAMQIIRPNRDTPWPGWVWVDRRYPPATGGTFRLCFNVGGVPTYTAPIAYNADAATIKTAVETLLGIGTVSEVLNSPDQSAANQVPFWDEVNVRQVSLINGFIILFSPSYIFNGFALVDYGSLTGGAPIAYVDRIQAAAAAVNAVQEVTLTGGSPSGVWGLVADFGAGDETTSNLAATANATAVQAAIEALTTPTPGDVVVTGNAGGPYTITFQAALGGQAIDQMQPKAGSAGSSNFGMTFATQFANAPAAGAVATLAHILDAEIVVEWST